MTVNEEEFNAEMQKQKERARNAAAVETGDGLSVKEGETKFCRLRFYRIRNQHFALPPGKTEKTRHFIRLY